MRGWRLTYQPLTEKRDGVNVLVNPRMREPMETLCYGCKFLTSMFLGDGTHQYGCELFPGLVKGMVGAFEYDEPGRCDKYDKNN